MVDSRTTAATDSDDICTVTQFQQSVDPIMRAPLPLGPARLPPAEIEQRKRQPAADCGHRSLLSGATASAIAVLSRAAGMAGLGGRPHPAHYGLPHQWLLASQAECNATGACSGSVLPVTSGGCSSLAAAQAGSAPAAAAAAAAWCSAAGQGRRGAAAAAAAGRIRRAWSQGLHALAGGHQALSV
jgi:hypothetical protein